VIGLHGETLYYAVERPLVDGTPEVEVRAATPENGPFRVLAHIPSSRAPIWQIVNPTLSGDGKWMVQALADGLTTNLWVLSTTTGEWRQITDFGDRATFIARRVSLVIRRTLDICRGRQGRFRHRYAGRTKHGWARVRGNLDKGLVVFGKLESCVLEGFAEIVEFGKVNVAGCSST